MPSYSSILLLALFKVESFLSRKFFCKTIATNYCLLKRSIAKRHTHCHKRSTHLPTLVQFATYKASYSNKYNIVPLDNGCLTWCTLLIRQHLPSLSICINVGLYKIWTLDHGLDYGLDCGLAVEDFSLTTWPTN